MINPDGEASCERAARCRDALTPQLTSELKLQVATLKRHRYRHGHMVSPLPTPHTPHTINRPDSRETLRLRVIHTSYLCLNIESQLRLASAVASRQCQVCPSERSVNCKSISLNNKV